ncbi:MAG: substrate-binding domain-containing protein [Oscillospiraceae bacterium]|nr:substrate-binding domain-containing protein [Oscillospiraceae bacterium]
MKKKLALLLALLMLALSACGQVIPIVEETLPPSPVQPTPTPEITPSSTPEPVPTITPESIPEATPEPVIDAAWWSENMPTMDGSTSLIPLEAGIRAALLDISAEDAKNQVAHSTTYGSFYNLINKNVDLIFSVPLSEQQLEQAADAGIELEQLPIAREGFVFIVNKDNPVDMLTQQQLRDIYSGKITNWSEVGGPDMPIIAYQRNNTSGSQNYMVDFMGDTPLMDAPTELRPGSMSLVIDVVAINDNAEQSIGYSVYSYAADMYSNISNTKFIAVDGVVPSKETMASGEYPLLSDNYAIFRADEPAESPVRRLCDWITSADGQLAIANAGYVPVMDIEFDYSSAEELPEAYSGVGCGAGNWDTPLFKSVAFKYGSSKLPLNVVIPEDAVRYSRIDDLVPYTTGITYTLECLENKELEAKINLWLADAVAEADENSDEFYDFLKSQIALTPWKYFQYPYSGIDHIPSAEVSVKAQNGYIWATVSQVYYTAVGGGIDNYYHTQCCTWDLFTGEVVEPEALFRGGLDIDEYLNDFLKKASQSAMDEWLGYPELKQDFLYLPVEGWAISPEAIYINYGGYCFSEGYRFSFIRESGVLCSEIYRDMSGLFVEPEHQTTPYHHTVLNQMYHLPEYTFVHDGYYAVSLLDETRGNSKARRKINEDVLQQTEAVSVESAQQFLRDNGLDDLAESVDDIRGLAAHYGWYLTEYGDRFAMFRASAMYFYDEADSITWPESEICLLYDLQTGERLDWQELLVDNWQELCTISDAFDGDISTLPPLCNINTYHADHPDEITLHFYSPESPRSYSIRVPISALKWYSEIS